MILDSSSSFSSSDEELFPNPFLVSKVEPKNKIHRSKTQIWLKMESSTFLFKLGPQKIEIIHIFYRLTSPKDQFSPEFHICRSADGKETSNISIM